MRLKIAILLGLIFFIFALFTLTDYGMNWDTINHLPRGQVYLRYLLAGKKDFSELPRYQMYWQKPEDFLLDKNIRFQKGPLRSYYQNDAFNFDWYLQIDGTGHPPLSDILSSIFNRVLFGHLKIINDIDSYRVYGVLLAAILVGGVFYWISGIFGLFSGFIASLSLALYPLFWSESHFNTEKDIPETAFFFFFIYSFWKGFTQRSWKWIIGSGIFFGLALGTKFNILFAAFIIIPWLIIYLRGKIFQKGSVKLLLVGILAMLVGIVIFYATWPFLWQDLIAGTQKVFGFYKGIGITGSFDKRFLGPLGINTYPLFWISITTPIIILFLFLVGLASLLLNFKKDKTFLGLIFILGFAAPVVRVTFPQTSIYGGIRQIMEYLPFMTAIAGIGAGTLLRISKKTKIKVVVPLAIILGFLLLAYKLYQIHPNENVFFNVLIGGLKGAKDKNIPAWGNSFGASYRQGFQWLNENAEENAKLVFAYELMPNAPPIWVRPDISFSNTNRSGFLRKGEYAITLTYDGTSTRSYYDSYLENLMEPVYEESVDGVSVVKVWKNDQKHAKPKYQNEIKIAGIYPNISQGKISIDLKEKYQLSYLKIGFNQKNCQPLTAGKVFLSGDNFTWRQLRDELPMDEIPPLGKQPGKGVFYYPFVGDEARYLKIEVNPLSSCLGQVISTEVYSFDH